MTRDQRRTLRSKGLEAVALAAAMLATLALVYLALGHSKISILAIAVAGAGVAIAVVPTRWLLLTAIVLFLFVPFHYLDLRQPISSFPPDIMVLALAVASALPLVQRRATPPNPLSNAVVVFGALFLTYTSVLSLVSPYSTKRHAVTWILLTAVALMPGPLLLSRYDGRRLIQTTLHVCCGILSLLAIAEFTTKSNPLDHLYEHSADTLTQDWGSYRVFTTLGHPLLNGTVLAIGVTVAFAAFVQRPRWITALSVPLIGAAVFLTASRSAIVAAVAGCGTVMVLTVLRRRGTEGSRFRVVIGLLVALIGVAFFYSSSALAHRNESAEAQASSHFRFNSLHLVPQMLAHTNYLGAGDAASESVLQAIGGFYAQYPIENSAVQLVVDFGAVGGLLFLGFALAIVAQAARRGALVGPAMLVTYVVAASGFNLFEAYTSAQILPCLALALTLMESRYGPLVRARRAAAESPAVEEHVPPHRGVLVE